MRFICNFFIIDDYFTWTFKELTFLFDQDYYQDNYEIKLDDYLSFLYLFALQCLLFEFLRPNFPNFPNLTPRQDLWAMICSYSKFYLSVLWEKVKSPEMTNFEKNCSFIVQIFVTLRTDFYSFNTTLPLICSFSFLISTGAVFVNQNGIEISKMGFLVEKSF